MPNVAIISTRNYENEVFVTAYNADSGKRSTVREPYFSRDDKIRALRLAASKAVNNVTYR